MSSYLSTMEAKLPPGFRFHPRDDELICDYLSVKVSGGGGGGGGRSWPLMIDVDLNQCEPWDLPEKACVGGKEWYFFNLRDRKYATGQRTNRATQSGYWKATGKDRRVVRKGIAVGARKTLVFYQGRAPKGKKTDWVMHEFRLEGVSDADDMHMKFSCKEDWVLCRVFFKSRGISIKPTMEKCCDDNNNNSSSSSLPPLMETYASFEQNPKSMLGFEQVPCFSNCQPSNQPSQLMHGKCSANLGGLPEMPSNLNPFSYDDKDVIRTILDQLNKLQGNPRREMSPNLAQLSYESCLFDVGFPSMWSPN